MLNLEQIGWFSNKSAINWAKTILLKK